MYICVCVCVYLLLVCHRIICKQFFFLLVILLQMEWAAVVIKELRSTSLLPMLNTDDTPSPKTNILKDEEGCASRDPFSRALIFYCFKALDFHETILTSNTPAPCKASRET